MTSFMIQCPRCGKPINTDDGIISFSCPYCGNEVDAKEQRASLIKNELDQKKLALREKIDGGAYEEARECALETASSYDVKAPILAFVLECDLLRHHLFFFDHNAIKCDVDAVVNAADFGDYPSDDFLELQRQSLNALNVFYDKAKEHLNRYRDFVGERYDAVERFIYVGECCLILKTMSMKVEPLAKDCASIISRICKGEFGDVYNMPPALFSKVQKIGEALSEGFRFEVKIVLQSNPHKSDEQLEDNSPICPICGEKLPKNIKSQFITCPACRHRVSKDASLKAGSFAEPLSYQTRFTQSIAEKDLKEADIALQFLRGKDSANPEYAIAALIVNRNKITPLNLVLGDYLNLLKEASSSNQAELQKQIKETAGHFKSIYKILSEAEALSHGPSHELTQAVLCFVNSLKS